MKKIIIKIIGAVLFLLALFIIVSFTQSNPSKKQVMIIKSYISNDSKGLGLAVIQNNEPTEFISNDYEAMFNNLSEGEDGLKKIAEADGKIFLNTLQNFYDKGWELEGITGGDLPTYILVK